MSQQNKNEATEKARARVGRSLLRYFKPLRTASTQEDHSHLHIFKQKSPSNDSSQDLKTTEQSVAKTLKRSSDEINTELAPPANASWISVVVYLLDACKAVSRKMGKRLAFQSYKNVVDTSMRQKMKIVGSIVNTSTDVAEEKALAKAELHRQQKEKDALALSKLVSEEAAESMKSKKSA